MHLGVARGEKWQEGIIGEKADIITTHAERSIQFESVDARTIIVLVLRAIFELHTIPKPPVTPASMYI